MLGVRMPTGTTSLGRPRPAAFRDAFHPAELGVAGKQ